MAAVQPSCSVEGCKERVMLGCSQACAFCNKLQCIRHLLPEVHGCRDAAKNAARMAATADASDVLRAKRLHETKDLRDKMAKKREELAQQRTKKKK